MPRVLARLLPLLCCRPTTQRRFVRDDAGTAQRRWMWRHQPGGSGRLSPDKLPASAAAEAPAPPEEHSAAQAPQGGEQRCVQAFSAGGMTTHASAVVGLDYQLDGAWLPIAPARRQVKDRILLLAFAPCSLLLLPATPAACGCCAGARPGSEQTEGGPGHKGAPAASETDDSRPPSSLAELPDPFRAAAATAAVAPAAGEAAGGGGGGSTHRAGRQYVRGERAASGFHLPPSREESLMYALASPHSSTLVVGAGDANTEALLRELRAAAALEVGAAALSVLIAPTHLGAALDRRNYSKWAPARGGWLARSACMCAMLLQKTPRCAYSAVLVVQGRIWWQRPTYRPPLSTTLQPPCPSPPSRALPF